jgi:hypothetical protein
LYKEIKARGFPYFARAISKANFKEACVIVYKLDLSTKKEFKEKAITAIYS